MKQWDEMSRAEQDAQLEEVRQWEQKVREERQRIYGPGDRAALAALIRGE